MATVRLDALSERVLPSSCSFSVLLAQTVLLNTVLCEKELIHEQEARQAFCWGVCVRDPRRRKCVFALRRSPVEKGLCESRVATVFLRSFICFGSRRHACARVRKTGAVAALKGALDLLRTWWSWRVNY